MPEWFSISKLFGGRKAAFDILPMGVQGRPQYPNANIEALQLAYTRNEIVYAAVRALATPATDPRLLVQARNSDGEWAEVEGHPMRRLLMRPNKDMDEAAFVARKITDMEVTGRFYAEITRDDLGLPNGLHPLNPAKVFPIPRPDGNTDYQFVDGANRVIIPYENMLMDYYPDPRNRWDALSPTAVALGSVDADSAQTDYIREYFNNAGVPSGILKILGKQVDRAEADKIKADWRMNYGRGWGNLHNIAVTNENVEYQAIGSKLGELQADTLRQFTETRVSMVYGVPPLIIYSYAGLMRATYSNLKSAWQGFWDSTLTPMFKRYRTWLTWNLLPHFTNPELIYAERIRLQWDMSQVAALQEDVSEMTTRAVSVWDKGLATLNEARAMAGLKPLPGPEGDAFKTPSANPFEGMTVPKRWLAPGYKMLPSGAPNADADDALTNVLSSEDAEVDA